MLLKMLQGLSFSDFAAFMGLISECVRHALEPDISIGAELSSPSRGVSPPMPAYRARYCDEREHQRSEDEILESVSHLMAQERFGRIFTGYEEESALESAPASADLDVPAIAEALRFFARYYQCEEYRCAHQRERKSPGQREGGIEPFRRVDSFLHTVGHIESIDSML